MAGSIGNHLFFLSSLLHSFISYLVLPVMLRASGRLILTHYALLRIHSNHCARRYPLRLLLFSFSFTISLRVCGSIGRSIVALYSGRRLFSFANFFPLWFGSRRPPIPSSPAEIQVLTSAIICPLLFFIRRSIFAIDSPQTINAAHF